MSYIFLDTEMPVLAGITNDTVDTITSHLSHSDIHLNDVEVSDLKIVVRAQVNQGILTFLAQQDSADLESPLSLRVLKLNTAYSLLLTKWNKLTEILEAAKNV